MMEYAMAHSRDHLWPASPWIQNLSSSPSHKTSVLPAQKLEGFFLPDAFDDAVDTQANFYLGDDFAHLFSTLPGSINDGVQTPESSPSPHADNGCTCTGPTEAGSRPGGKLPHTTRKVVTLAPASPRSPVIGDLQPPKASRYHKRREQNRAAQRAFRQRKEQHVKDLEDKVASLEKHQADIKAENLRLQEHLNKATAENNVLRNLNISTKEPTYARSTGSSVSSQCDSDIDEEHIRFRSPPAILGFDSRYVVDAMTQKGGRLIKGSKIWEFILGHRLYQDGLVDVGMVAQHIQKFLCRGTTSGVMESSLIECIEKSAKL